MFRKAFALALMVLFPVAGHSISLHNCYLRGFAGYNHFSLESFPEVEFRMADGYLAGGALGYKFSPTFRMEGEISYRHNRFDEMTLNTDQGSFEVELDGEISFLAFMANAIFAIPLDIPITPYVGVGLGGFREKGKLCIPALKGTEHDFLDKVNRGHAAYQALAGLNLYRTPKIDAGIEYRYLDSLDDTDNPSSHSLAFSFQYKL